MSTDTNTNPEPTGDDGSDYPFPQPVDRSDEDGAKGYAVYDRELGSFLPGVHTDRKDATAAAKGGDSLTVVKV